MRNVNLNNERIFVSKLENGEENFIIKVGRSRYYLDIKKDSSSAFIDLYPYFEDRNSKSKYDFGSELRNLCIKNDATIDKTFIEDFIRLSDSLEKVMRSSLWRIMKR